MGLYGKGMHDFILAELELGFRVACKIDEYNAWGPEGEFFWAFNPGPMEGDEDEYTTEP
jgi:hypothetical protein